MTLAVPTSRLSGGDFLVGAHHPHCDRHRHHLIWVGRRPLCLGCTCMAVGLPLGVALGLALGLATPSFEQVLALGVLLVPTAVQPFFQRKAFKVFARTCAGIFSGVYGVVLGGLALRSEWWLLVGSGAAYLLAARALLWLRARFPDNPCARCPLGAFPTCSWNLDRLLASADPLLRQALSQGQVEVLTPQSPRPTPRAATEP
jgi:hypothetical protein